MQLCQRGVFLFVSKDGGGLRGADRAQHPARHTHNQTARRDDRVLRHQRPGGYQTARPDDRTADLKAARNGQGVWEVTMNLIEY